MLMFVLIVQTISFRFLRPRNVKLSLKYLRRTVSLVRIQYLHGSTVVFHEPTLQMCVLGLPTLEARTPHLGSHQFCLILLKAPPFRELKRFIDLMLYARQTTSPFRERRIVSTTLRILLSDVDGYSLFFLKELLFLYSLSFFENLMNFFGGEDCFLVITSMPYL